MKGFNAILHSYLTIILPKIGVIIILLIREPGPRDGR